MMQDFVDRVVFLGWLLVKMFDLLTWLIGQAF
jgi:hypothetical protein